MKGTLIKDMMELLFLSPLTTVESEINDDAEGGLFLSG